MIRIKNNSQIMKIRESAKILSYAFAEIKKHLKEGVTTLELDEIACESVRRKGAKPAFLGYLDYPASLCVSLNDSVIHGIPDATKVRKGDVISLDFGVEWNGFFSDSAYTFTLGPVPKDVQRLIDVTKECLCKGIEAARAGNRVGDISRAVFSHARKNGFGVVTQFCGHGVGFELHEEPQIPNYIAHGPNPRLKPGMVLAIEPMINLGQGDVKILDDGWTVKTLDGSISAHFEHTVAVLVDRTEILTDFEFADL